MAVDENGNEIVEEGQDDSQQTLNADDETDPEGQDDQQQQDSSPVSGADRATEERLKRLEERNQYLETTQRLLDQFNQQQGRSQQPQNVEPDLPEEAAALDKMYEPAVNRRIKKGLEPLIGTITEMKEESDAIKFDTFLNRSDPELFDPEPESESRLNQVYQNVDAFRRQIAQQRGQWISRQDAYLYLEGVRQAKEKIAGRKGRINKVAQEERKRIAQVSTIKTLETNPKKVDNTDQALVQKLRSNQRLTAEEMAKLENSSLGNTVF